MFITHWDHFYGSVLAYFSMIQNIPGVSCSNCHNLAKWLKLLFIFLLSWIYYTEGSAGKCHITMSHHMTSHDGPHDRHGKVVHRPCGSCISSVENLMGTLLSSFCQSLNKEQLALFQLGV